MDFDSFCLFPFFIIVMIDGSIKRNHTRKWVSLVLVDLT